MGKFKLLVNLSVLLMVIAGILFSKLGFYSNSYSQNSQPTATESQLTSSIREANSIAQGLEQTSDLQTEALYQIGQNLTGERIKDFHADITIMQDGSIVVVEKIKYFFDSPRHGIFRNIPFTKYDNGKRHDMDFEFRLVTDENNNQYKVSKSKEGEQWVLKIGDPDKTITGEHTYIITYKAKGALGYFENHDELYWNVTGTEWEVPIQKASITITLPTNIPQDQIRLECFTGPYGSTQTYCKKSSDGQASNFFTSTYLNYNEGLTVIKGFPKGIVEVLKPELYIPFFERWYGKITLLGIIATAIFWYLLLPVYLIFRWYYKGRDPFAGIAATAAYGPPKVGTRILTPAETGALLDEHVNKRDIFATIVDLARRGHIKISEPKDKEIHLIKATPKKKDVLLPFEQTLFDGIFISGNDVNLNDSKLKDVKFYTTANKVETELYKLMVDHKFFTKNPRTTRNIYYGIGGLAMFTFNFVLALVCFVFGRIMPRKTMLGARTAKQAEGLKNFLTSQERQLNFQGDKQMLFEKLLPYASAFGVEKAWAKRFEAFDLKDPEWYQGTSGSRFNSYVFASHLSSSYSSFAASSTPPSSSSSGFSGGSSGGGGGGGGGGSW